MAQHSKQALFFPKLLFNGMVFLALLSIEKSKKREKGIKQKNVLKCLIEKLSNIKKILASRKVVICNATFNFQKWPNVKNLIF